MFKIHHREIDNVEPFLLLPITEGEAYSLGEALKLAEGQLLEGSQGSQWRSWRKYPRS